jgi:hypothetical protein
MVNELSQLMRDTVAHPPHDDRDLAAVLRTGRRRVRRRRARFVGGTALAAVGVVGVVAMLRPQPVPIEAAAGVIPEPSGPVLRLSDATSAVEGRDYRALASYTNEDLDADNGQYFDGVTDDGLILFRDGPRTDQPRARYALMDPSTGEKVWLPDPDVGQRQLRPLDLGRNRLVFVGADNDGGLAAYWFDRNTRQWSGMKWRDLPAVEGPVDAVLGPDDRLYITVPATRGQSADADEGDAEGWTYHLWSASLSDGTDVRDEGLTVGSIAFSGDDLVYTDSTNGDAGLVHVQDLATGRERTFDPKTGERCNLLEFGATDDRILMSQYCGTYHVDEGAVRDDRIQILTTDGDQVATLQDNGAEGTLAPGADVVSITSSDSVLPGNYVYDLESDRFLRLSNDTSSWVTDGPTPAGQFLWHTPVNRGHGSTQHLGELLD